MSGGSDIKRPRISFRYSLAALFVVLTGATFASCCCGVLVRHVKDKGLEAEEANRRLEYVLIPRLVPDQATSVDVEATYNFAYVSFSLPLEEYRALCRKWNWDLRRFEVPPDAQPQCTQTMDRSLIIRRGYYRAGSSHRSGIDTWYDLDRGRAWIFWARR